MTLLHMRKVEMDLCYGFGPRLDPYYRLHDRNQGTVGVNNLLNVG